MRALRYVASALVAALLAACTSGREEATAPAPTSVTATSPTAPAPTPRATNPHSLPALFDDEIPGGRLQRTGVLARTDAYTRYAVTYRSGRLTISGIMNVPRGDGPFPAVVLNHGYIDPAVYRTGQGMPREQDYLARKGFVVLHTDYRGHAGSDDVSDLNRELRLGYARDAIAAVKALRELPEVTTVAMAGRSMGGGVTFNALVAQPGIVDAAVVWASVSTRFVDNFRQWTAGSRTGVADEIMDRFGGTRRNPRFWRELSARTYADRIDAAVLMHHGTLDESCPFAWAEATRDALGEAGVDLTFHAYPGEGHTFSRDWELSMERTVAFLRDRM